MALQLAAQPPSMSYNTPTGHIEGLLFLFLFLMLGVHRFPVSVLTLTGARKNTVAQPELVAVAQAAFWWLVWVPFFPKDGEAPVHRFGRLSSTRWLLILLNIQHFGAPPIKVPKVRTLGAPLGKKKSRAGPHETLLALFRGLVPQLILFLASHRQIGRAQPLLVGKANELAVAINLLPFPVVDGNGILGIVLGVLNGTNKRWSPQLFTPPRLAGYPRGVKVGLAVNASNRPELLEKRGRTLGSAITTVTVNR